MGSGNMASKETRIEHEGSEKTSSGQQDHQLVVRDKSQDTDIERSNASPVPGSSVSDDDPSASQDRAADSEYEEVRRKMLEVLQEKIEQTRLLDKDLRDWEPASTHISNISQARMDMDAEHESKSRHMEELAERESQHDEEMARIMRQAKEEIETRRGEFGMRREKRNEERRERAEWAALEDKDRKKREAMRSLAAQRREKKIHEAADLTRERQRLQRTTDRERARKRMEEDEEDHERRMEAVRNIGLHGFEGQRRRAAETEMEQLRRRIEELEATQRELEEKIRLYEASSSDESDDSDEED